MRWPAEPTFFTDRDLGKIIPKLLAEAGYSVERHDDHFGPKTPDPEWLLAVGSNKWVAFTRDKRIRYTSDSLKMVMRSRIPLFILVGKNVTQYGNTSQGT